MIYKYHIPFGDHPEIRMPEDADIISASFEDPVDPDTLHVWAEVENTNDMRSYMFYLVKTGSELPSNAYAIDHVETLFQNGYVWHLFEDDENWDMEIDDDDLEIGSQEVDKPTRITRCSSCILGRCSECTKGECNCGH